MKPSLKLSMVGGTDAYHAYSYHAFTSIFNSEEKRREQSRFEPMAADARIVKVYDDNKEAAQKLARKYDIETICDSLRQALTGVDAVIIPDDCSLAHHKWAPAVIESGLPFFLDKPLAPTVEEAESIVAMAEKHDSKMFSSSSIRFSPQMEDLQPIIVDEGPIQLTVACGPNNVGLFPIDSPFLFYGIHAVELVLTAMGPGVETVQNIGSGLDNQVKVTWPEGRTSLIIVSDIIRGYTASFYTKKDLRLISRIDHEYSYYNLMRKFIEMVVTGKLPISWDVTLEVIRVCETAEQAARRGDQSVIRL